MKKCYFIGMSEIFDAEIIDTLKEKCEKIIEAEDLVEFWFFHGENFSYTGSVSVKDGAITLRPVEKVYAVCRCPIDGNKDMPLCDGCISKVKAMTI